MKEGARRLKFSELSVGATFSFEREITEKNLLDYARLTGDFNPLHTDPSYGAKTQFKGQIAHGMLVASLFSTLVGMYCPGEKSLYLSQSISFRRPVKPGDCVTVSGTIVELHESVSTVVMKTEVFNRGEIAVDGEARVRVLEDE